MEENTGKPMSYSAYLMLPELLGCQRLASASGGTPIHDEHLFIITHQAYELWFKQMLFEIDSIRELLSTMLLDESKTLHIIKRLQRVVVILKLLVDQFHILETMTPLDFLEFRTFLTSASGFQSLQFRLLENKLGVKDDSRVKYNQQHYKEVFDAPDSMKQLKDSLEQPSLLLLIERWLERTPGLDDGRGFSFWQLYRNAVNKWLSDTILKPAQKETCCNAKETLMAEFQKQNDSFETIFDPAKYEFHRERGDRRMSHRAFKGALLISLYREMPRFNQPFQLITLLMDIDSLMTKWRYNHVMLVQRMIGSKIGTGGSSGYQYLRSTISDRYKVFIDLFNLSTYLVPRDYIPPLSGRMKRKLSVLYTEGLAADDDDDDNDDEENGLAEGGRAMNGAIVVENTDGELAEAMVSFTVGSP